MTTTNRRASVLAVGALAALIFVAVLAAGIRKSPDLGGVLSGIFTALFAALVFALAALAGLLWLVSPARQGSSDAAKAAALAGMLGPALAELETTRGEIVRQVNARLVMRVPLGIAGGVGLWIINQFGKHPGGVFGLLQVGAVGGAAGYFWASHRLSERYRSLYKERVLPQLAAQFGELGYRAATTPNLASMTEQRLFRDYDLATAEDEIFGRYRGLAISITEAKLTRGAGKHRQTVFDGLLTEVTLPRVLIGTTAVIADNGTLGNLRDRFERSGRERVRVEDPRFEQRYEVYGTDQIGARALLTPAFMERLLALGDRAGFSQPLVLALTNRLTIALPKAGRRNLFEPPSYRHPAKSEEALVKLHDDIAAVLLAADAVIDLDQGSRAVAHSRTVEAHQPTPRAGNPQLPTQEV